ncbi:hypothetical protein [Psychrobacter fozii]|uniref:Uncharacterized protein n=1 Tax=Psychrobacter fozii TaxID=198480 RepID=A0A2V4VF82_9GAMM|nr:hypothetical protein [Psychrobacter fozii]PYE40938.1 hypothetical protein DFP82_101254 [Psychrobacter fozii]
MRESDYNKLLAEKSTLESLIEKTPSYAIVDRISLESRLQSVQENIQRIDTRRLVKTTTFTFRGKPVDRSHGITAEFSGKALDCLNDMIASVVASLNNNLSSCGPIPNKEQNQLLITGTATGSFGFELELPEPNQDLLAERNGTEEAIDDIQKLLSYGIDGTDEQISDVIEDIHPRAVRKVYDFLDLMLRSEALFAIEYNQNLVRIDSKETLDKLISRFSDENINEYEEEYSGEFVGILPHSRNFEFIENSNQTLIRGKIDNSFSDPDVINREYLHKYVSVKFCVIQVGQAKPKYTLKDIRES